MNGKKFNANQRLVLLIAAIVVVIGAGTVLFVQFLPESSSQQELDLAIVEIDGHRFDVEIADSPKEHELGLSYRESMARDHGMLFIFSEAGELNFWMKGMTFPLDMIFLRDGRVVYIAQDVPSPHGGIPAIVRPDLPADMVLELNAGIAEEFGIIEGSLLSIIE